MLFCACSCFFIPYLYAVENFPNILLSVGWVLTSPLLSFIYATGWRGRKSRGAWGRVPTEFGVGTLMQIAPFQILSCF